MWPKKYYVMALVIVILLLSGTIIYTAINIKRDKDDIPITDHDDTNMHMGEVSYDTYRLDIDPKYFEHTSVIPQPESIYDEEGSGKKERHDEEIAQEKSGTEGVPVETDIQSLDSKLEQASAQIAALQKEVERLKQQKPDSV